MGRFLEHRNRMELNGKYEKKQDPFKYRRAMRDIMLDIEKTENDRRDKHLLSRIIVDSTMEQKLTTQLLSVRKEKEFLIANRKRLEKEFEIQREKQLSEALDREAEIARIIRQQQNEIFKIKRKEHQVRYFGLKKSSFLLSGLT